MKATEFIERLEYLIKQYGDLNLSDCFDYVIGFIYHSEIWDKGTETKKKITVSPHIGGLNRKQRQFAGAITVPKRQIISMSFCRVLRKK